MKDELGKQKMTKEEIRELLELKSWNKERLASELNMTSASVYYWLTGERNPLGPAVVLMRLWLEEARGESKGRKPVGAK